MACHAILAAVLGRKGDADSAKGGDCLALGAGRDIALAHLGLHVGCLCLDGTPAQHNSRLSKWESITTGFHIVSFEEKHHAPASGARLRAQHYLSRLDEGALTQRSCPGADAMRVLNVRRPSILDHQGMDRAGIACTLQHCGTCSFG